MFKKGQVVTIKKRGASAELKSFGGNSALVERGGKNVKLTIEQFVGDVYSPVTIKVSAESLATSIKAGIRQ